MNDPKASRIIRLPQTKPAEAKARYGEIGMCNPTGFKGLPLLGKPIDKQLGKVRFCTSAPLVDGEEGAVAEGQVNRQGPYLMTQTEERVINDILAVLNKNGLDAKQSVELLEHLGRIIEMGSRLTRGTTH